MLTSLLCDIPGKTLPGAMASLRGKRRGVAEPSLLRLSCERLPFMLCALAVLVCSFLGGGAPTASAAESYARQFKEAAENSPVNKLLPAAEPLRLSVELSVGLFRPSDSGIQLVYGEDALRYRLSFAYYLFPEIRFGAGIGFLRESGTAVGKDSHAASLESAQLDLFPLSLETIYSPERLSTNTLHPFVGVGFDCHIYSEEVSGDRVRGSKWGAHLKGGIAFRVDGGPLPTWTSDANRGIRSTSLLIEVEYGAVNNLGTSDFDLSGLIFSGGVSLAF